jgi:outer membrane protein assembly factor BamB
MHGSVRPPAALVAVLFVADLVLGAVPGAADDWPQWRGPTGDGVVADSALPLQWSEQDGVAWKCPLPEWGNSTPAIWGSAIFVTSHVDDRDLVLLKIEKSSGRIEWTRHVGAGSTRRAPAGHKSGEDRGRQKFHNTHNLATPSPVTDGEVVIVHFGNGDLAAYDFSGKRLWLRNLQQDFGPYTIWWGHGNSPVLHEDLVISVAMQDNCRDFLDEPAPSYVAAHDRRTGALRWKTPRMTAATMEQCDSYTTPVFRRHDGRLEMIVMGGQMLDAYDPATGKQLWSLPDLIGNRVIPSPIAAGEMIFAIQGMREPLVAVRIGGDGKRTADEIVWQSEKGTSDSPSPVFARGLVFMVANNGIAHCFDAASGRLQWKERIKGEYRASPIAAAGRVYFLNTAGLATVVSASKTFERLAENSLDDETVASPAVSEGRLYLRGRKSLYCIGP